MPVNTGAKLITCQSLGEAWLRSLRVIIEEGESVYDGPDRLLERLHLILEIARIDPEDGVIDRYYNPDRRELMRAKYFSCGVVGDYKISYGKLFFDNDGVNQIDWAIERLQKKPETKSATITFHRPGETDLSCISMLDFKQRDDKLLMTAVYRSQNVYASQPGNVLAIHEMQRRVAESLGCQCGPLYLIVSSAHIYYQDLTMACSIASSGKCP